MDKNPDSKDPNEPTPEVQGEWIGKAHPPRIAPGAAAPKGAVTDPPADETAADAVEPA